MVEEAEEEEVVRGDMDGLRLPPLIEEALDSTGLCCRRFFFFLLLLQHGVCVCVGTQVCVCVCVCLHSCEAGLARWLFLARHYR